jgi:GNAT superfamily N-acetyltransferase
VEIRGARPDDATALARLVDQLGYPTSAEAVAARLRRLEESPADRIFVAELDGEVVGAATVHFSLTLEYDEPAAKLSAIVVDESRRRRGIGEALVAAVEEEATRQGCCLVFLTTAERRADAHAFYRRLGYEETGRRFAKPLKRPSP